jgi:hypothetical protein
MLAEIIERNKSLLKGWDSYLLPQLDRIIDLIYKIENSAANDLSDSILRVEFLKGDYFLREGVSCNKLLLLETGIARQFKNKNGDEPIACFFIAGEFVSTYKNFQINTPSEVNIQFISNASGFLLNFKLLEKLKCNYPIFIEIEALVLGCRTQWLLDRLYDTLFCSARERYCNLLSSQPLLQKQISLTHMANYLGVSLETLSRIRAK